MKTKTINNHQLPILDFTKKEDFLKTVPNNLFIKIKIYETELPGQKLIHHAHPTCEYNEHSAQQHGVVVHLKPIGSDNKLYIKMNN